MRSVRNPQILIRGLASREEALPVLIVLVLNQFEVSILMNFSILPKQTFILGVAALKF
jgi:hypothetical protein